MFGRRRKRCRHSAGAVDTGQEHDEVFDDVEGPWDSTVAPRDDVQRLDLGSVQDLSGKPLAGVPKFTYTLGADIAQPLGRIAGRALQLYGHGDFAHRSSLNTSSTNSRYAQVPGYGVLNARIGVRIKNFTLTAFGRNLTNEDSIPMATRWFDYRYGYGTTGLPAASTVTFNGSPATIDNGAPRAFFAALRKGRTFGVELGASF